MNQKKSRRKKITTVKGLYQSKGTSYEEVQETTRKRVAVELLARGVRPEIIYSLCRQIGFRSWRDGSNFTELASIKLTRATYPIFFRVGDF